MYSMSKKCYFGWIGIFVFIQKMFTENFNAIFWHTYFPKLQPFFIFRYKFDKKVRQEIKYFTQI